MIELVNVSKSFGAKKAIDNLTLTINDNEILGFLGPNGAGKTTTMRLITGYLSPDSGVITVDGIGIIDNPCAVKKRIGYLAEDNPLYPYLKVQEYLMFIAEARAISLNGYFQELIEICGIKEVLAKGINELSKGYRQRVGLTAAMLHDPSVLIMDEPTSGLDPNQIAEIRELIKELGKEKTVVLSTHILPEVEATCNRIVIINNGAIIKDGTLDELTKSGRKSLEQVFRDLTLREASVA